MRRAALCALGAIAMVACLPVRTEPPPVRRLVAVTDSIVPELTVLGRTAYFTRVEHARCVTAWLSDHTRDGTYVVIPTAVMPAEIAFADSLSLYYYPTRSKRDPELRQRVCGDSLPSIHTHDARFSELFPPSDTDSASARLSSAPFQFILTIHDSSTFRLLIYRVAADRTRAP